VGQGAGLDDAERKKDCPCREWNTEPSAVQPLANRLSTMLSQIVVLHLTTLLATQTI
jgi:hypothetical protein